MAVRLQSMKRVLKDTGSIFLHCDPTASHYLKSMMDVIFGTKNFKNEIAWCYRTGGASKKAFARKHDVIFLYSRNTKFSKFNVSYEKSYLTGQLRHSEKNKTLVDEWGEYQEILFSQTLIKLYKDKQGYFTLAGCRDYWNIDAVGRTSSERLGYPTQKPLPLMRRIIKSTTNEGDVVLDPFCGCGTTLHAAEELNRQWIGIDISQFSTGLVRNRLVDNFYNLDRGNIPIIGCPLTVASAKQLASTDRFEFEKWACGEVGAEGLFHEPGQRGADGGVDGIIPFYHLETLLSGEKPKLEYAVVQVKSGKVTPDNVKALSTTVRESGGKCGVFICFEKYMNTVENNREKRRFKDVMSGEINFIQGLSVENLIEGEMPDLPPRRMVYKKVA